MDKRTFLKSLGLLGLAAVPSAYGLEKWIDLHSHIPPKTLAGDEDFWSEIRAGYRLKPDYINLENGFYCMQPEYILEAFIKNIREVNYEASFYMRGVQHERKRENVERLAKLVDCNPDELTITRNTTESLDLIIGGFPWKEGDEAIMAEQDYGAMLNMFKQVAKRHGVVNRILSVPNHPSSDEEIVKLYEDAITDKTKLIMVCHMINISGQILPVRKICDMAHKRGVQVMVDGAHAVAHFTFSLEELDCDYYGASLHKWLSVPLGAGLLYVKKKHIPNIWPLIASGNVDEENIMRLNHMGTHPVHTEITVSDAIDYYYTIGPKRKEERLRYLQRYWTDQVRGKTGIILNTPEDPERSCGIANVGIEGINPKDLAKILMDKYRIFTVGIGGQNVLGCRITPNVYTSLEELDALVEALMELANG